MHQLLNTLYITTEGAYLRADHETLRVEVEKETKLQVPFHHIGGVVCFGDVMLESGRDATLRRGRPLHRLAGPERTIQGARGGAGQRERPAPLRAA